MAASKPLESAPTQGKEAGSGSWGEGPFGFDTFLVHGGTDPDTKTGAILTPIYMSTTFVQDSIETYLGKGYSYTRSGNPTVKAFERRLAALENGYDACAFATGMAATVTVFTAFLSAGDHCVICNCSYGGTNRCARVMFSKFGIEFTYVDFADSSKVEAAIKPNTKLIFSETPANPTLVLTDVAAISKIAKAKGILHACDSTFATPVIMRPLDLGADMTVQSTTKFYDGHNICLGGAVISATKEVDEKIRFYQNIHGNVMTPQVAFQSLQSCKTMGLRVKQQSKTAQAISEFLSTHPKVDRVVYPGLKSFPQKELADRQHLNGIHGSMLWFEVKGGSEAGRKLMNTVPRPWSLCENLGATESIITCPSVMTHANMLKEDRLNVGITDGFVRVSCGIEDADDLIRALKSALDAL